MNSNVENYLNKFRDPVSHRFHSVTASEFFECWQHYDTNGNGYLEDQELNNFLRELVCSVVKNKTGDEILSESAFEQLKIEIMDAFDENQDGRIDINELVQILPIDESFAALFQLNTSLSSSVEFVKLWKKIDTNKDGLIDLMELKTYLKNNLLNTNSKISDNHLDEYCKILLKLFDQNQDGSLQLNELSQLIKVKENHLLKQIISKNKIINKSSINYIFQKYDLDRNGYLESDELLGFIKDCIEITKNDEKLNQIEIKKIEEFALHAWDKNQDGKISKEEAEPMIMQIIQMLEENSVIQK